MPASRIPLLAVVCALIFLVGGFPLQSLHADTITLNSYNGDGVSVTYINPYTSTQQTDDTTAGQFSMTFTPSVGSPYNFYGFCVDLSHTVGPGMTYHVNVSDTNDPNFQNKPPDFGSETNGAAIAYVVNKYAPGPISDNDTAAAVQIAIWTLLGDGANGLTSVPTTSTQADNGQAVGSGNVWFTSSIPSAALTEANTILQDVANNPGLVNASVATWYENLYLDGAYPGQGQSVVAPTPAPSSVILWSGLGLGFILFAIRGRRSLACVSC